MALILGIDIGTSSAKAILLDPQTGQIAAAARQEYPVSRPAPDRAEQNPEDWWNAAALVTRRVVTEAGSPEVAAVGLTGQMHGTVLLDEQGRAPHPAIIWADQRSAAECTAILDACGRNTYTSITGTLPAAGFMGPTLVWIARHHPALLDKARTVLLPKDYVRFRLTGEIAAEISDAASTGLFDVTRRSWADLIIEAVGLPRQIFPDLVASTKVAGYLSANSAAALGLRAGIPVVAGCADQPAQAVANGVIAPGMASVTIGTGGQVFVPAAFRAGERVPVDARVHVFNHAVPDVVYILGAILAAGMSLRWLRDVTGLANVPDAYSILSAEADGVSPGANGLIFLPYLAGERTPHMDPLARGGFIGLSAYHERGHLARAVMEGVAFALRQTLEISLALSPSVSLVIAAGGGAESGVWRQIQADVFGIPLRKTRLKEQACVGAALLAGVGIGVFKSFEAACKVVTSVEAVTEPNPAAHAQYDDLYRQFLALYPRLRADFHVLSRLGSPNTPD